MADFPHGAATGSAGPPSGGFVEVGPQVWVARQAWYDVNVCVVGGQRGLLVVDTHASVRAARTLVPHLRRLGAGRVVAVVNTHEHADHTFGNAALREEWPDVPIHAHEWAAAHTGEAGAQVKREYDADPARPCRDAVLETPVVPADVTVSSARAVDLGDRLVELVHPGRGHTAGDLVVRVPDADVLLAGDVVEESAPPSYGPDSHPLEWPAALDLVLALLTDRSVVVPGHGAPVGRAFVQDQRVEIGLVAQTIRDLAGRGVPPDQALAAADWPYPRERLVDAVRRGYQQLPPGARQLPRA